MPGHHASFKHVVDRELHDDHSLTSLFKYYVGALTHHTSESMSYVASFPGGEVRVVSYLYKIQYLAQPFSAHNVMYNTTNTAHIIDLSYIAIYSPHFRENLPWKTSREKLARVLDKRLTPSFVSRSLIGQKTQV